MITREYQLRPIQGSITFSHVYSKIECAPLQFFIYGTRHFLYDKPNYEHRKKQKWNESGFRPPLCTYRLNWARRTSWGWWDDWDDTVLQTQDSKFEPWRSEAEHATSRSRRLPTILTFTRGWGRNMFCFFQTAETGNRTPNSGVEGSGANHYPRAPAFEKSKEWTIYFHIFLMVKIMQPNYIYVFQDTLSMLSIIYTYSF